MNVQGFLNSEKTGNSIAGRVTVLQDDQIILSFRVDNKGVFWLQNVAPNAVVKIESDGFETQTWQGAQLDEGANIFLLKPTGAGVLPIIGLAAAALYFASRKKEKVGEINKQDVAFIGLGFLGFSLFRQLMEKTGIWDSRDTKELNTDATDPGSPWNPTYWQKFSTYSYAITQTTGNAYAKEIYNAVGPVNDCEECVKAVFKRLRTKANVSFLVWCFSNLYGQDLLSFLRGGWWPQDRLSDADVNEINNYIKNLPNN